MNIPLSAPDISEEEISAVTAVLRRPQLSLGPELEAFEHDLAAFHGAPDAVAISSGTAGLHLALITLGIGPGHEVILPSFTFVAVANVILQVGATPVFADIDPTTLNLDPASVRRAITPRTRAIIAVHTFGIPADMTSLQVIASEHNLFLIEDTCEAIGARHHNQLAGTLGHLSVFGFYPNKQMTTGEGGAILTQSPEHATRLRSLRNQGRIPSSDWLDHHEPGFNYRLSELACALGRVQLRRLPEFLTLRTQAAARYNTLLSNIPEIEPPPLTLPDSEISWFVYVIRLAPGIDRDQVRTRLAEQGIATGRYFPPIHQQPAWQHSPHATSVHLPITESIAPRTLALPFFNRILPEQQNTVAEALKNAIQHAQTGAKA